MTTRSGWARARVQGEWRCGALVAGGDNSSCALLCNSVEESGRGERSRRGRSSRSPAVRGGREQLERSHLLASSTGNSSV